MAAYCMKCLYCRVDEGHVVEDPIEMNQRLALNVDYKLQMPSKDPFRRESPSDSLARVSEEESVGQL